MKVTKAIALKAARELIAGETQTARRIVEAHPTGGVQSWAGVFRKLIAQAEAIESGTLSRASFSIWAKNGNSKLPFVSFSSMAILDCPGRGECATKGWCYSLKAWRNPNALGRQASNSMLLRSPAGRDLIAREFAQLITETVRLYVDGDFDSKETLTFWMDLIKTRPDIQVYGYSKSWVEFIALHLSDYAWPANYLLNLSGGSRFGEGVRVAMESLPVVRGEFLAVPVDRQHLKNHSYQSRRNAGFRDYAKQVRENAGRKIFVCSGDCGDCLTIAGKNQHACGSDRMRGVAIAIGTH